MGQIFLKLTHQDWVNCFTKLNRIELGVLFYFRTLDGSELRSARKVEIKCEAIAEVLDVHRTSVSRAIDKLEKLNLLPSGIQIRKIDKDNLEFQIRNRLHKQIGGLKEVSTPAGRIDLLTDTEIIEIKRVSDWKAALGQILVYSAYYPEHQKRLHLFGNSKELEKLTDIESACLTFNVCITGEEFE